MMTTIRIVGWSMASAACLAACSGTIIVEEASGTDATSSGTATTTTTTGGPGGAPASGSGSGGASTETTTTGGIQSPSGASSSCALEYYNIAMVIEGETGCTPSATEAAQCTGKFLLHDPCGCLHVVNDTTAQATAFDGDYFWTSCAMDGCCGVGKTGCSPCTPAPTSGHCDSVTSQCVPGP